MAHRAAVTIIVSLVSLAFVLVGVASDVVVAPSTASAAQVHPNVLGAGHTTCTGAWTGTLHFSPPLKNGGTATRMTVWMAGVAKPCTGGAPTPTYGTILEKGVVHGAAVNSCAHILPSGTYTNSFLAPGFSERTIWTPAAIAATLIRFPTLKVTTTTAAAPVQFKMTGPTVAGTSYANAAATETLSTTKTYATIKSAGAGDCGNGGVSSLTLRTVGTTETF